MMPGAEALPLPSPLDCGWHASMRLLSCPPASQTNKGE